MVSTDPVADMLTRIRNAMAVHQHEVLVPYSKLKESVAELLAKSNYLESVTTVDTGFNKKLHITINKPGTNPAITEINRVSKPGRRLYAKVTEIPTIKNGRGLVIVSTSQGLMSGAQARKARMGGEVICKVY